MTTLGIRPVVEVADPGAPRLVSGMPRRDATVAVCVPVYQGGTHLAATLASISAQTMDDVEIVVLDNASTDGTAEVLAAHRDRRMTVWRNPATVPMSENFNRVVALSHAPLVKVVPADDLLEPGCLALQVADLTAHPEVALVAGRKHLIDDQDRMLARSRFLRGLVGPVAREAVVRRVVRSGANPIGGDVAVTFRREAFLAAGGYAAETIFEDLNLWLRLLDHGAFLGERETVARFRVTASSRSAIADVEDYLAQRRFTGDLVAQERQAVRRRDRAAARIAAPLARRRRELLFGVVRLRSTIGW